MYYLLSILLVAAFAALVWLWSRFIGARRDYVRLDERYQHMKQEKEIVSGFTHNLTEGLGEDFDRKDIFQRITRSAILGTGALSAAVFIRDEEDVLHAGAIDGLFPPQKQGRSANPARFDTRAKYLESIFKSETYALGEGVIGAAAKDGEAILVADATADPRVVQLSDPTLRVTSLIAAPMIYRKHVLGVLSVANPSDGSQFTPGDLSLIQSFAEQAALALHNADLMKLQIEKNKMDFDLALASSVQSFLLPHSFPNNPQLEIDARYRPAKQVGGDLYDLFSIDDHRIGAVIADVSGKGVSASLLMAICHTHLRHCFRKSDSPAEVLRTINREMSAEVRQDMFITITYAIIDLAKDEITLARAGHELPVLFRAPERGGKPAVERVGSEGMALGMVPPLVFDRMISDKTVPFRKGDTFCLYTDGATEAPGPDGEEFGTQRFIAAVSDHYALPVRQIDEAIITRIESYAETTALPDDLTLITVRHR